MTYRLRNGLDHRKVRMAVVVQRMVFPRSAGERTPRHARAVILGNIKNFEPGAGARRFEQGRREAWAKEQDVLERLRALPDGARKPEETKRMIDRARVFNGYREYPKTASSVAIS